MTQVEYDALVVDVSTYNDEVVRVKSEVSGHPYSVAGFLLYCGDADEENERTCYLLPKEG